MSAHILETSGIGHAINKLRRDCSDAEVQSLAKSVTKKWRRIVKAEMAQELPASEVAKKRARPDPAPPGASGGNGAPLEAKKRARTAPACGRPGPSAAVVNVKVKHIRPAYNNLQEWMGDAQNMYIGRRGVVFVDGQRFPKRDSKWHNPFKIDKKKDSGAERARVLDQYRGYVTAKIEAGDLNLAELRGKTLGCWCHPLPCHGHVLHELLQEQGAGGA